VMACVYCVGVPLCSLIVLWWNKVEIKKLQKLQYQIGKKSHKQNSLKFEAELYQPGSPKEFEIMKAIKECAAEEFVLQDLVCKERESNYVLDGIAPLYQDYEAKYWWFEVLQLVGTFFLIAVVTTINLGSDGSTVFLALVGSVGLLLAFANCNPYIDYSEDLLAQALQLFITYVLAIGLLSLTGAEDSGVIMTVAAACIFGVLIVLFVFEMNFLFLNFYPAFHAKLRQPWVLLRASFCAREQPAAEIASAAQVVEEGPRKNRLVRSGRSYRNINRLTMRYCSLPSTYANKGGRGSTGARARGSSGARARSSSRTRENDAPPLKDIELTNVLASFSEPSQLQSHPMEDTGLYQV